MKLIELQQRCDKKKYIESEKAGMDLSGGMEYCSVCKYANGEGCDIDHNTRVALSACGRAYNKAKR